MPTNLTTLTNEQLAERAAACLGWKRRREIVWSGNYTDGDSFDAWADSSDSVRASCEQYSPATDDAQAAELMRFAVEKCGARKYADELMALCEGEVFEFLATADARCRTCAAVACLEGQGDA